MKNKDEFSLAGSDLEETNGFNDFENPNRSIDSIINRIRRFQIHEIYANRKLYSEYYHLFPILKRYDDKFEAYTRMVLAHFIILMTKYIILY